MIPPVWSVAGLTHKFRMLDTPERRVSRCRRCGHNTTSTNALGLCEECDERAWERLINDIKIAEAHEQYNKALGIREA